MTKFYSSMTALRGQFPPDTRAVEVAVAARRAARDAGAVLTQPTIRPRPSVVPLRAPGPVYDMQAGDNRCTQCGHTGWIVGRITATCGRCGNVADLPASGRAFDHGFRSV